MESAGQDTLAEAMDRLWVRFLPQLEERVAALESAATALAQGTLVPAQREQASEVAHKLAGVLGTFGLDEGTSLARETELAYSGDHHADSAAAARLSQIASQLRAMVAGRK
ncbi:MAG: Hpt domain-containing protein [Acidobacteriota bacterium]|nr:Hpt domain-containing protein [Acidobacteriota bacterium]